MTFIYQSVNTSHKITDAKGNVLAAFTPDPPADPSKGLVPQRGVFATEDQKLALQLEKLGDHGITRAAGSADPNPAKAPAKPEGDKKADDPPPKT